MLCRLVSSMLFTIITASASYSMTPTPTLYSQHVDVVNGILSPQPTMTTQPSPSNEQHAEIEFGYQ
jgi:hypothetical protein